MTKFSFHWNEQIVFKEQSKYSDIFFTAICFNNINYVHICKICIVQCRYEWRKNGVMLIMNWSRVQSRVTDGGSITIVSASALDEGYYQCLASNQHGVALTRLIHLIRAVLQPFPPGAMQDPVLPHSVTEGDEFRLNCNAPRSVPTAAYSWSLVMNKQDSPRDLLLDKRIQMDDQGL